MREKLVKEMREKVEKELKGENKKTQQSTKLLIILKK